MFGKKKAVIDNTQYTGIDALLAESEKWINESQVGSFRVQEQLASASPEINKVLQNILQAVNNCNAREQFELMKYKLANKSMNLGLWDVVIKNQDITDIEDSFTWSDEVRKMLGFSGKHDFPDKASSWINLLHPEDKRKALRAFSDYFSSTSSTSPYSVDYRMQLKSGEYRYFRALGEAIRDSSGVPTQFAGMIVDIHDEVMQKQAAEKMTGLDSMMDYISKMHGHVLAGTYNTATQQLSGLSDELVQVLKLVNEMMDYERDIQQSHAMQLDLIVKSTKMAPWEFTIIDGDYTNVEDNFKWSDEMRHMLGFRGLEDFPNKASSWNNQVHPDDLRH
jgi:PAS domain S-box-containing protein